LGLFLLGRLVFLENLLPRLTRISTTSPCRLPGNGTNGAQNNTFLDSSTNNFTITRNGNATQGTFSPYGNLWSNYFDGSGIALNLTNSTAL
jgi:hypothetical protein